MATRVRYSWFLLPVFAFLPAVAGLASPWQSPGWNPGSAPCPDNGSNLPLNNQAVLQWKQTVQNGWRGRAHVFGYVVGLVPDRNDHIHTIIQIGSGRGDVLEVVYNEEFGALPPLSLGMAMEACGDFIQSYAENGPYPPSPAGAIIHWLHVNPRPGGDRHDSGYLIINGQTYGTSVGSPNQRLPMWDPNGYFRLNHWR